MGPVDEKLAALHKSLSVLRKKKRYIQRQIEFVQQFTADTFDAAPGVSASLSQQVPSSASYPPNKRRRPESDRSKREANIWNQCATVLKNLIRLRDAGPFKEPVSVKYVPDYYDIIKRPMDLGTISNKLGLESKNGQKRAYSSPTEFRDDVRLVWANCRIYNKPGEEVRKMGDYLSDVFEKRWAQSQIERKWTDEMSRQSHEDQIMEEGGDMVAQRLADLDARSKLQDAALDSNEMNFERKRRLGVAITSLPGEKLVAVLQVLADSITVRSTAGGCGVGDAMPGKEFEIDLDSLDVATLKKLQGVVNKLMAPKKSGGGRKSAAAKAPSSATGGGGGGGKRSGRATPTQSYGTMAASDMNASISNDGFTVSMDDDVSPSAGYSEQQGLSRHFDTATT